MGRSSASIPEANAGMVYLLMVALAQPATVVSHWPPEAALHSSIGAWCLPSYKYISVECMLQLLCCIRSSSEGP